MADLVITDALIDDPALPGAWDTVWIGAPDGWGNMSFGDFALADASLEPLNAGGLQATSPLATAILIQLNTRARRPDVTALDRGRDPGGWHGDLYDLDASAGEREMGSLLWTLMRGPVTPDVLRLAEHHAATALQPLIDQGAVDRFEIVASGDQVPGVMTLTVTAIDATGQSIFAGTVPVK